MFPCRHYLNAPKQNQSFQPPWFSCVPCSSFVTVILNLVHLRYILPFGWLNLSTFVGFTLLSSKNFVHPFPFRLVPKISGRDLLLVEECCNAPDLMRQVSASYSPSLPSHVLACCILPCHHLHFIRMFFKTCIRSGSAGSLRCPFRVRTHSHAPVAPPKYILLVA